MRTRWHSREIYSLSTTKIQSIFISVTIYTQMSKAGANSLRNLEKSPDSALKHSNFLFPFLPFVTAISAYIKTNDDSVQCSVAQDHQRELVSC